MLGLRLKTNQNNGIKTCLTQALVFSENLPPNDLKAEVGITSVQVMAPCM